MVDIDFLYKSEIISDLDYYFAMVLCKTAKEKDPIIFLSLALTSRASLNGNVYLDIDDYAGKNISDLSDLNLTLSELKDSNLKFPIKSQWLKSIENSSITGKSIEYPLVYDKPSQLYLARYYDFQQRIVKNIVKRLKKNSDFIINTSVLNNCLNRFFPETLQNNDMSHGIKMQKKAVINAISKKFTIISGGPGTGKTFIIEKFIQLLNDYASTASMEPLKIITAAPTGKAASKLKSGSTIHRMLGATKRSNKFIYNKDNPIPCDILIIDEASMIDIALMTRLLEAVPENARLIMLGDRHQLASVEAGAVFGDICRTKMISSAFTSLDYNFRSGGSSGINMLAKAVNAGNAEIVEELLLDKKFKDISFVKINNKNDENNKNIHNDLNIFNACNFNAYNSFHYYDEQFTGMDEKIIDKIIQGYLPFIDEPDPVIALEKFNHFRILCPHKKGPYGTVFFNSITEKILFSQRKEKSRGGRLYKKPVMVNVNDYNRQIFNGDTGVAVKSENDIIRVFFKLKSFLFSELPSHEDAFAMTVHKSQGSEFDHVLFVLPLRISPVVTRQLIYTGITRAKKSVTMAGTMEVIKEAVRLPVKRSSKITELINRKLAEEGNP